MHAKERRNFDCFLEEEERRPLLSVKASPISSLPLRRVDTERQGFYLRSTLHARLLDSHFMLFALNCSLRSSRRESYGRTVEGFYFHLASVGHTRRDQFDTFRQLPTQIAYRFSKRKVFQSILECLSFKKKERKRGKLAIFFKNSKISFYLFKRNFFLEERLATLENYRISFWNLKNSSLKKY